MWSLYFCDQIPIFLDSRLLAAFWVICWECTGSLWNGFKTCISRCFWISPSGTWLSAARCHDLSIKHIKLPDHDQTYHCIVGIFTNINNNIITIPRSAQPYKWWPRSCSQQLTSSWTLKVLLPRAGEVMLSVSIGVRKSYRISKTVSALRLAKTEQINCNNIKAYPIQTSWWQMQWSSSLQTTSYGQTFAPLSLSLVTIKYYHVDAGAISKKERWRKKHLLVLHRRGLGGRVSSSCFPCYVGDIQAFYILMLRVGDKVIFWAVLYS